MLIFTQQPGLDPCLELLYKAISLASEYKISLAFKCLTAAEETSLTDSRTISIEAFRCFYNAAWAYIERLSHATTTIKPVQHLTPQGHLKCEAKLKVLEALDRFRKQRQITLTQARRSFPDLYNQRKIVVPDWVYDTCPTVSFSSLNIWGKHKESDNRAALAGLYKKPSRPKIIHANPDLESFLIDQVNQHSYNISAKVLWQLTIDHFGSSPSEPTIRRFLNRHKQLALAS